MISFTQGDPTEHEIAAVVSAVLLSRGRADARVSPDQRADGWAGYWRRTRRSLSPSPSPGPDAWRLSMRL